MRSLRSCLFIAICVMVTLSNAYLGWAAQSTPSSAAIPAWSQQQSTEMRTLQQKRQENEENLLWTTQGIRDMDKNKTLRLTRDQAKKILVVYEKWVKEGTIRLEVPKQPNGTAPDRTQRFDNKGSVPTAAQQQKALADMKMRETVLTKDIDKVEGYLSAAQVRFLDNLDFKPDLYGLRLAGSGGVAGAPGVGAAGGSGNTFRGASNGTTNGQRPDEKTMERLRQDMQKRQAAQVKLYKELYNLLKLRAK